MIDGQGNLTQRLPPAPLPFTSSPFSSTSNGCIPGKGKVAYEGLAGVMPAMLEIIMPPVSVCHQVSTIGQRPFPICSSYQCQASSLMGSPTVPNTRRLERSLFFSGSKPKPIRLRIAVGAVYRILTLNLSTISQNRPASGKVGMPSNNRLVAPALN